MIQIFGTIEPPPGIDKYSSIGGNGHAAVPGLIAFASNIVKFAIVIAGIYALINIVLAGYGCLSAGDDPKKITAAWAKIWQSLLGLLIVAGAFVLAALFGWIIFQDAMAILAPSIYGPN